MSNSASPPAEPGVYLSANYRVYKVEKGRRSQLQSADVKHSDGWHTLRVIMEADHIEGYYDSKKYLDVRDPIFREAGRIGLWTKADAQSYFDDFTVRSKLDGGKHEMDNP